MVGRKGQTIEKEAHLFFAEHLKERLVQTSLSLYFVHFDVFFRSFQVNKSIQDV